MTQHLNKSFSRRIGKSLSALQKDAIENLLPKFLLTIPCNTQPTIAEIGIGMGEHFIAQAKRNPDIIHIGFEPYLNGIANALLMAEEVGIENIRLWPDDMDLIFNKLPDHSLNAIYILFPDPWPKTKQKKRRIICPERLVLFHSKLQENGRLYFASDIADYVDNVEKMLKASNLFELLDNPSNEPHEGYIKTKYHGKAELEDRVPRFLWALSRHSRFRRNDERDAQIPG